MESKELKTAQDLAIEIFKNNINNNGFESIPSVNDKLILSLVPVEIKEEMEEQRRKKRILHRLHQIATGSNSFQEKLIKDESRWKEECIAILLEAMEDEKRDDKLREFMAPNDNRVEVGC